MKSTRDLWFASFLLLRGYKVKSFKQDSSNKYHFEFSIDEESWTTLKLEYSGSDVSKVKYFQEQLKDLIFNG